jgi:hypothetical protein
LYICTRFKKSHIIIEINTRFKDTKQCANERFNHRKEREEINTDLWTEWLLQMEEKSLRVEEQKEDIN